MSRKHGALQVVFQKFAIQPRLTHLKFASHTGQVPPMHTDPLDDQLDFNLTLAILKKASESCPPWLGSQVKLRSRGVISRP